MVIYGYLLRIQLLPRCTHQNAKAFSSFHLKRDNSKCQAKKIECQQGDAGDTDTVSKCAKGSAVRGAMKAKD